MKKRPKEISIEYELTDLPITALGGLPVVTEAAKALGSVGVYRRIVR